jgi:hypothetical protein
MVVPEHDAAHVWAGTFDPQQSKVVRHVQENLKHRMLDVTRGETPGQEVKRERDREEFQAALAQLNDGLSDLCFNMRQSEPDDEDTSWPPEMDIPYPVSAPGRACSSNLSKATSVPAPRQARSSNSSAASVASSGAPGHADKVEAASGPLKRAKAKDRGTKHARPAPQGAHDVFQHDLWVDERVNALMEQVKEAQAKLGPKLQDRSEIADLVERLDRLERRSAVAGQRATSISDPPVSGRQQRHAHAGPHSPFSLPTIREAGGATKVPHAPHQQQQYYAHPPAQRPADLSAGHSHWRHRPYLQPRVARGGVLVEPPLAMPANAMPASMAMPANRERYGYGMLFPPISGRVAGPNAGGWADGGSFEEYGGGWKGVDPGHKMPSSLWRQESPQVRRIETQSERRQSGQQVSSNGSDSAEAGGKKRQGGGQSAHMAARRSRGYR